MQLSVDYSFIWLLNTSVSLSSFIYIFQGNICHNNICQSSIFVASDGSWKVGGLEYMCRFQEANASSLSKSKNLRFKGAIAPEEQVSPLLLNLPQFCLIFKPHKVCILASLKGWQIGHFPAICSQPRCLCFWNSSWISHGVFGSSWWVYVLDVSFVSIYNVLLIVLYLYISFHQVTSAPILNTASRMNSSIKTLNYGPSSTHC